ncbi:MAG: sodium-independent anion transporter [Modestobacter sp.]|jgi:SulP family sulfate permease|nr:sodium-independent anion transporter [Modestobacter sp.]
MLTDDGLDSAAGHALPAGQVLAYRLDGPLFSAVADRFLREITATPAVRVEVLRLGSVVMLDATGARVLGEIVEVLHRRGITVLLKGASAEHRRLLGALGTLAPSADRGHVFATFPRGRRTRRQARRRGHRPRPRSPGGRARPPGHPGHPDRRPVPNRAKREDHL